MRYGPSGRVQCITAQRAIRSNSLAQRARNTGRTHAPAGQRPNRSTCGTCQPNGRPVGPQPSRGCPNPGPLAQAIGIAGPLGRNRKPPARWPAFASAFRPNGPSGRIQCVSAQRAAVQSIPAHRAAFNALRPNGPSVPIAWPIGPGTRAAHMHLRANGPTVRHAARANRMAGPLGLDHRGDVKFLGRWPRLLELLALWAGIANRRPVGPRSHPRFAPNGPSGRIQCVSAHRPIGPCPMRCGPTGRIQCVSAQRAIRSNSLAHRARNTGRTYAPAGQRPNRSTCGTCQPNGRPVGPGSSRGCQIPGPLAQAIGIAGPLGRNRKPSARVRIRVSGSGPSGRIQWVSAQRAAV